MRKAIDLVLSKSKQEENRFWALEHTYNGRFQVNIEKKVTPANGS